LAAQLSLTVLASPRVTSEPSSFTAITRWVTSWPSTLSTRIMPGSMFSGDGTTRARSPRAIVGLIEPPSIETKRYQRVPTMPALTKTVAQTSVIAPRSASSCIERRTAGCRPRGRAARAGTATAIERRRRSVAPLNIRFAFPYG
jgi:hypothetical protein